MRPRNDDYDCWQMHKISEAVAAMVMAFDVRAPLVIYNASGSAPLGFYHVENRLPTRGELALIKPPPATARTLDRRPWNPAAFGAAGETGYCRRWR